MAAALTTISSHSARREHRAARPAAGPSLRRVLAGVVLLTVGLLAWVGGQWSLAERGWEPGALVQQEGAVVKGTVGEQLVLWVPRSDAGQRPACRVSDPVFGQELVVSSPAREFVRTVGGRTFVGAGVFTAASSATRVACRGASVGTTAVAAPPEGPAALREGRWAVLVAMGLGLAGVAVLGRELLGTELTAPVRRRTA